MEEKVKIWWDEKEEIGRYMATDEITNDMMTKIEEMFFKLAEKHDIIDWLLDLREFSKLPSSHVRKRLSGLMKQQHTVGKVAVITSKLAIRVTTNFVLVASGKTADAKFFSNEEEALKWLKKGG